LSALRSGRGGERKKRMNFLGVHEIQKSEKKKEKDEKRLKRKVKIEIGSEGKPEEGTKTEKRSLFCRKGSFCSWEVENSGKGVLTPN